MSGSTVVKQSGWSSFVLTIFIGKPCTRYLVYEHGDNTEHFLVHEVSVSKRGLPQQ